MASNRERVLDAAIEILAAEGIRALTHRRVDQRAGLPEGSTSNVFRTRDALVLGITEHMAAAEFPAMDATLAVDSADDLAAALAALFDSFVGPLRTRTAARLALFVEASHDERVREALAHSRSRIVEPVRASFARIGTPDPDLAVGIVATCFEGLSLQVLGGYADLEPGPVIAAAVRAAMAAA